MGAGLGSISGDPFLLTLLLWSYCRHAGKTGGREGRVGKWASACTG
jgi:hypothetical protein